MMCIVMVVCFMPTVAWAETCSAEPCTHEAAIGTTHYDTLSDAISKASSNTVTLLSDISLTGVLTIPAETTVTLDLAGHSLTQTGTTTRYDEVEEVEYEGGINAINNYGDLIINGTGSIIGTWNGIYNVGKLTVNGGSFTGTNNAIYNEGTLTIKGGTFTGTEYNGLYNAGTATINDGAFTSTYGSGICNEGGTLTIKGGKVAADTYCIDNCPGSTLTVSGGTLNGNIYLDGTATFTKAYTFDKVTTSSADSLNNLTYEELMLTGEITSGTFKGVTKSSATFPASSTAVVHLNNAVLGGKIYGGTFDGTVNSTGTKPTLYGGRYSASVYNVLSDGHCSFATGYGWVEKTDGTYSVENVGTVTVSIKSNNKDWGKAGVNQYKIGGSSGSGSFDELNDKNGTKGAEIEFSAAAKPASESYVFAGWYTNPDGNGEAISTEATLTKFHYKVNEDTTIYAVFKESSAYQEQIAKANAWVGDYSNTTAYTVSSKDDMWCLAYAVNNLGYDFSGKTVTLTNDLDYTGIAYLPVGTQAASFNGTFDGGKNTISNISLGTGSGYSYAGIFGKTGSSAVIKQLNIASSSFYGSYAGGIVAEARGKVESCSANKVEVYGYFAGGIVGHTFGMTMSNVTATDITLKGYWKSGAIVGYADGLTLNDAKVSDVTIAEEANGLCGALAGHINAGKTTLENVAVYAPDKPLVATTYGSITNLVITGGQTALDVQSVVEADSTTTLTIEAGKVQANTITSGNGGTVKITGGNFTLGSGVRPETATDTDVSITGGTFSRPVSEEHCPEGYIPTEIIVDGKTTYGVKQGSYVAAVTAADGSFKKYETLQKAVDAAKNGDSVTLLDDVALTCDLRLGTGSNNLNLNLSKKTIDGGACYQVYTAGKGTIKIYGGGTIKNTNVEKTADAAPLRIYNGSNVVLDDVMVNGVYCAVKNSGNLTVKIANITGGIFGIGCFGDGMTVIGKLGAENSDIVVTAKEQALATAAATGLEKMNVTVYCGTFISSGIVWDDCPVYWAGHGTLNLYGGVFKNETSETGAAGLLQKNGTVNIYGGSFSAKDGFKIVAQGDSTEITANITEGTFTGVRSGIYVDASNSTYMNALKTYSVKISGGLYEAGTEGSIYTKTGGLPQGCKTLDITGGTFDTDPTEYVASGYTVTGNGPFTVKPVYTYIPTIQKPTVEADANAKTTLSADGTKLTIEAAEGYEIADVTLNGVSKGAVKELTGLKTGDKVVVMTKAAANEPTLEEIKTQMAAINSDNFYARSKLIKMKSGKKAVKVTWYTTEDVEFDGVEIFRSTKRYSGYGTKPFYTTTKDVYYNTAIKDGAKYYYKVRGYVLVNGEKVYTDYSTKAWRTV